MKKLFSTILFLSFLLSWNVYADENYNFICRMENQYGKLENEKYLFELSQKEIIIDGEKYKLSSKPEITNSLISFNINYKMRLWKKILPTNATEEEKKDNVFHTMIDETYKINRSTGQMVEKSAYINWNNEDRHNLYYYKCEIF
jgi:hypothetical protein